MIAVALDPGVTTGLCVGFLNKDTFYVGPDEQRFTLPQMYDYVRWFADLEAYVIYEDFQYRNQPRTGLDLTPVKMIGVIEMVCEIYEASLHSFKQTPAQGKGFYSDARLKSLDIYKVGKPHGRDATRHLMQWGTFGAGSQFIEWEGVKPIMLEVSEIYEMLVD